MHTHVYRQPLHRNTYINKIKISSKFSFIEKGNNLFNVCLCSVNKYFIGYLKKSMFFRDIGLSGAFFFAVSLLAFGTRVIVASQKLGSAPLLPSF